MAEQSALKPPVPYVSSDPEADFQNFKDTLRRVVSVPKEVVDKALTEREAEKKQRKEQRNSKNGTGD